MQLTHEEQNVLNGEEGPGKQKAMEILVALGKIYNATRLFPIKSVQVAGVSYNNLGDAGLEFLQQWANQNAKASVPAMLNPAGMDLKNWQNQGITKQFAEKQQDVIHAYTQMGIKPDCTCTPYLIGMQPEYGQHVAWSESSAVTYINSIIGARTNREGGPSALASAIIGKTPYYGLHLQENRQPDMLVKIKTDLKNSVEFSALGYHLGKNYPEKIPYITGIKHATQSKLKALSASIVTYGGPPLFHIENITAEAKKKTVKKPEKQNMIDEKDIKKAIQEINDSGPIDLIFLGCPHCSLEELEKIALLLKNKKVHKETWIATARKTMERAKHKGIIKPIETSGAKVVCDTCVAVTPLKGRFHGLATNSAKACYYSRGTNALHCMIGSTEKCIKIATEENNEC
ncbi:aconitase X catalytic domain-containing protein [archaeon]|nr:aconitase X catalytic domain-containing protein [archaeon]